MHPSRCRRLAWACRGPLTFLLVTNVVAATTAGAATITGRVTDPDSRSVAAARVVVATGVGTLAERVTGADGLFTFDDLPPGRFDVRVVAEGFQASPVELTLGADETRQLDVHLRLSAIEESVVVSAAQIDVPVSRAGDTVTVLSRADLQTRQVETVGDALRMVPGLALLRNGSRGAVTSLFPRGGASNYTLVLVDGVRANAFGGGYDFAHLSVADVDRIEVVRGPQSALFGSDAIGGVVQIVTRRGGRPRIDGLVEGGAQGTVRTVVDGAGSAGRWSWGGGGEQTRSTGFTGIAPATGETVSNDDYHLSLLSGSLAYNRPEAVDFLITANVGRNERGFPGPFGSNPIGSFTAVDRVSRGTNNTRQLGSRFGRSWSANLRQRVDASFTRLDGDFVSPFGMSSTGTTRVDLRVQEDAAIGSALSASGGVEYLRESGSSTFVTGATGDPIDIERAGVGVFGELRYAIRDRLFMVGGVRLERLTRDPVEASPGGFSPRPAFPRQMVNSLNPKIAASYVLGDTRLHVSAGTGLRPPDVFEIAFTDNADLKPERSRSIEVGVEQQFSNGRVAVGSDAFFNRYDDLIVTVGRSLRDASRYSSDNISNARARGIEITGSARPLEALTVRTSYTFLSTSILSIDGLDRVAPAPFTVGDPLLRRPRHQAALAVSYAGRRLTAFGELSSRSRTLDVEPSLGSFGGLFFSSGYAVANAGVAVPLRDGLQLYARIMNLADRQYEETLGFPALRRSAIVGVRIAAGQ